MARVMIVPWTHDLDPSFRQTHLIDFSFGVKFYCEYRLLLSSSKMMVVRAMEAVIALFMVSLGGLLLGAYD